MKEEMNHYAKIKELTDYIRCEQERIESFYDNGIGEDFYRGIRIGKLSELEIMLWKITDIFGSDKGK